MSDTLMWVLLCVWLINMVVTVMCTAQIWQDLERMEQIWKEMQKGDHGDCENGYKNSPCKGYTNNEIPLKSEKENPV